MNTLPMTSAGYIALQQELKDRLHVKRPDIVARLQQAMRDDVNLTENSDYQAAVADQAANENRIAELEDKLTRAEVIDLSKLSGDVVRFGATVTVLDEDSHVKRTWQIVGEPEADARCGRISVSSPTARAFMGKSRGDSVEVHAPAGVRSYTIKNVEWPDALRSA
ncbi:transcription elongation factor GreA [Rhodoplanes sp. Z2-YC6860]|uniref:transcription elongation factor GreA n=1 Tax=Rhodoplanes sp. Z2-YC6860 TaxID=674703 RepID=UPI00078DFAF8|nr:transcription elongation factor GreA [Rhodoplanes sp. Z2-YC6860]AMN44082.1 transcription elongation factor GreA [Rhodoplanes sp. Z2-YC6860]